MPDKGKKSEVASGKAAQKTASVELEPAPTSLDQCLAKASVPAIADDDAPHEKMLLPCSACCTSSTDGDMCEDVSSSDSEDLEIVAPPQGCDSILFLPSRSDKGTKMQTPIQVTEQGSVDSNDGAMRIFDSHSGALDDPGPPPGMDMDGAQAPPQPRVVISLASMLDGGAPLGPQPSTSKASPVRLKVMPPPPGLRAALSSKAAAFVPRWEIK